MRCLRIISNSVQLFIKSKPAAQDQQADLIDASALRSEFKAAPITQAADNVLRIDPAVKAAVKEKRFHSRVYVGTVHASLKFLPNRNWYPGNRCCASSASARLPPRLMSHAAVTCRASFRNAAVTAKI